MKYINLLFISVLALMTIGCARFDTKTTQSNYTTTNSEIIVNHTTIKEVYMFQGEPLLSWKDENGIVTQVAYSNQPIGYKTFIIKFDENGIVKSISQTMNEKYFKKLTPGMSQEDIRKIIGPEKSLGGYDDTTKTSYNFSFCSPQGKRMEFKAIFDTKTSKLEDTVITKDPLYGYGDESNCKPYQNYKNQ